MSVRPLTSQVYEIQFTGHLDPSRAQAFEGLEMSQEPDGDTVLRGPLTDQPALHGVLDRIRDLGLPDAIGEAFMKVIG
jgi:hypothetical protein